jgi:hypothetical protein
MAPTEKSWMARTMLLSGLLVGGSRNAIVPCVPSSGSSPYSTSVTSVLPKMLLMFVKIEFLTLKTNIEEQSE